MSKNPIVFFLSLLLIALVVVVFYQMSTDPFKHISQTRSGNQAEVQELRLAMQLYSRNCSTCHGAAGEGQGAHPSLKMSRLTAEQIKNVIRNGRGKMPAFNQFSEQDLERLARLVTHF